jgi:hypothetical protein
MNGNSAILEVEHLTKAFKGLIAVNDYSLKLRRGEIWLHRAEWGQENHRAELTRGHIRPTGYDLLPGSQYPYQPQIKSRCKASVARSEYPPLPQHDRARECKVGGTGA